MPAWRDVPALERLLARASRRATTLAAARGAATALLAAVPLGIAGARWGWPLATVLGGIAIAGLIGAALNVTRTPYRRLDIAREIERRTLECRNLVVTAAEIVERATPIREDVGARICRDAVTRLSSLNLATIFPAGGTLVLAACAVTALAVLADALTPAAGESAPRIDPDAAAIRGIEVTVTPPAYAGGQAGTLRNPEQVAALAGSRLRLTVRADAAEVALETVGGTRFLASSSPGIFTTDVEATTNGFLAFEPRASGGRTGTRRMIGLVVTPDRAPVVRLTRPGTDLYLPDGARTIELTVAAEDDLALRSLRLTYTKATGAGENFDFTQGEVPLALTRKSDREWTATASWPLAALALEPGDLVVYRGVAADARPGAVPVESDAFIVEILSPGSVAAEGFAVDDQREKYALSQQMVILKTERLIARQKSLPADAVAEESYGLGAEQRQVRAEFVFLMGGEVQDEEVEAAEESELLAGRLANRGRRDLLTAIRLMSDAATALNEVDLQAALAAEREALAALQRAFVRSRYLLRTLTTRERIDLERRLTGVLADLARDPRAAAGATVPTRRAELRRILSELTALSAATPLGSPERARAGALAADVLRLDATAESHRQAASDLAGVATGELDDDAARMRLDRAIAALVGLAGAELPDAPGTSDSATRRLGGALRDAQQKRGGR